MLKSKIECGKCGVNKKVPSDKFNHNARIRCPNCKEIIIFQKNIYFDSATEYPNIDPNNLMHPLDKVALNTLKRIPWLNKATQLMMKHSYEKVVRVSEFADDIKVTSRTCSYIHDMVIQASKVLGIPVPNVYINQNPVVNAYTTCVDDPIIVIHSGLIELCDDDELFATIAHEMGHIKCEHVLYHMLADFIALFPDILGLTKLITGGIHMALMEWSRKSELSADRASFVVTENKEKIISLLMKLAGGSSKLMNMIDYDDFLSQYSEYDKLMNNLSDKMIQKFITLFREHPFPIVRAHEINKWPGFGTHTREELDYDIKEDKPPKKLSKDNSDINEALLLAILKEQIDKVRILLGKGANIDCIDEDGDTPLILAVIKDNLELIRLLLKHGANVEIRNKESETALTIAEKNGKIEIVRLLTGK